MALQKVPTDMIEDAAVTAAKLAASLDLSGKTLTLPAANRGTIVQVVNTQTGAVATGSDTIPFDDTIPQQSSEGDEYMTLSITPTSAANKLKIDVTFIFAVSALAAVCVALFQDSTENALAVATTRVEAAGVMATITFSHYMTAGTASATTFKVKAGPSTGTLSFNGSAGTRRWGGTCASSITITEIRV
jgi:hypothetical protein